LARLATTTHTLRRSGTSVVPGGSPCFPAAAREHGFVVLFRPVPHLMPT